MHASTGAGNYTYIKTVFGMSRVGLTLSSCRGFMLIPEGCR